MQNIIFLFLMLCHDEMWRPKTCSNIKCTCSMVEYVQHIILHVHLYSNVTAKIFNLLLDHFLHYLVRLPIKFDDGNNIPLNSLWLQNTNSSNCLLSTSILLPFESIYHREMSTYWSHTLTIEFTRFMSWYNAE